MVTLCLNVLLPAMALALATAADASQPAMLCVPDAPQADHNGVPLPAREKHECSGCAIHHGPAGFAATSPTVSAATVPGTLSVIRPEKASRRSTIIRRGSSPRGPPHLS